MKVSMVLFEVTTVNNHISVESNGHTVELGASDLVALMAHTS